MSKKKKAPAEPTIPQVHSKQPSAKFDYQLDRLFHEKARLSILTCLISKPVGLAFSDLKDSCGLSDGNLNRHLQVLIEAECLDLSKSGAGRTASSIYKVTANGRRAFEDYLMELERVLLDAQKAAQFSSNRRSQPELLGDLGLIPPT